MGRSKLKSQIKENSDQVMPAHLSGKGEVSYDDAVNKYLDLVAQSRLSAAKGLRVGIRNAKASIVAALERGGHIDAVAEIGPNFWKEMNDTVPMASAEDLAAKRDRRISRINKKVRGEVGEVAPEAMEVSDTTVLKKGERDEMKIRHFFYDHLRSGNTVLISGKKFKIRFANVNWSNGLESYYVSYWNEENTMGSFTCNLSDGFSQRMERID